MSISTASRQFALLLTASASFASAQHPYHWTPTQPYADTAHGVSFRVPPAWEPTTERLTTFDPAHNETHPMLMESNDPAPTAVFTADSPYPHTAITGVYFLYSLKPVPDAPSCDKFAASLSIDEDEVSKPHPVTFNGVQFTARHSNDAEPTSRRGIDGTLYSTFRSGMCYLFETTATTYDRSNGAADDDYKWAKENHIHPAPWHALHSNLLAIMQTVRIASAPGSSSTSRPPATTIYRDPETGVSFRFPATWKQSNPQTGNGYSDEGWAMMPRDSDGKAERPRAAIISSGGGRAFVYAVKPAPNLAACLPIFHPDESDEPSETVINWRTFEQFSMVNDGACRDQNDTVDVTFAEGQCMAFDRQTDTSCLAPKQTGRDIAEEDQLDNILQSVRFTPPQSATPPNPPPLTTYTDPKTGVSFQYPAVWHKVTEVNASNSPLSVDSDYPPHIIVQFTGDGNLYRHTRLQALVFLYWSKPADSKAACDHTANLSESDPAGVNPDTRYIHGIDFLHTAGGEGWSGNTVDAQTYIAYKNGLCHVFEEDVMSSTPYVSGRRNLTPNEARTLHAHLDAIMQTVRISNPETNASTSPNVPMTRWHDPASGVSLQYPSVWTRVKGADDYCGAVVLSGVRGQPKPTFAVEFRGDGNDYANTSLASLAFLFGHVPHSNPATCQQMATGFSEEGPRQQVIHGTTYNTTSGGECGLGHSVDAKVFTTLRASTCYIFEEDFFTARADGARDLTDREMKALDRHLDAIMQSVQWDKKNP